MQNDTHYHPDTPQAVRDTIDRYITNRRRVRLVLGDQKTGWAWGEENDVVGHISRSMGPCKVPILLANARSTGGGAIGTDHVIAIYDVADRRQVYCRPGGVYFGEYQIVDPGVALARRGYLARVDHRVLGAPWTNVANFKSREAAERWVGFMTCKRFAR